ncbi:MAG: HAD family hydrolase [Rhodospirillales bacterium]|nr:HAD family hydrolase [Rhodospirillales bacterium]
MLIIFDCDGVLVDSEMIASQELAAYLSDLGRPTSGAECREAFTGISIQAVGDKVRHDWGLELPQDFVAALRERDRMAFERDLAAIPGIFAALDDLDQRGLRYCVASSGTPEKIRHSLELTGLIERFDGHLFSASQVARGKPAPDLFLFAAASMNTAPNDCIVIEDSPAGVAGAKAAGMRVLGFTGGGHCGPDYAAKLSAADAVFDDMAALVSLL